MTGSVSCFIGTLLVMRIKFLAFLFFVMVMLPMVVWAKEDCMDDSSTWSEYKVNTCISEVQAELRSLQASIEPNEVRIRSLEQRIKVLQNSIDASVTKMKELEEDVRNRSEKVSASYTVMSVKTREMYKKLRSEPLWVGLLRYEQLGVARRELTYRQESSDRDKQIIINLVSEIGQLEIDKRKVEEQKRSLSSMQAKLDVENTALQKVVKEAKAYQSKLTSQLARLSAKQQQFLAEKLGSLNLPSSLGGGTLSCVDDRKLDPGFSNAFAFYTYGIPHRVGMDQYGAYGRAKAGQSAEDILRAYFDNFEFTEGKEGENVKVNGVNEFGQSFNNESMNIEEYLKHLHEMPASWDSRALEAQAIAARSYALSEQRAKGWLYPSQKDQVVKKEANVQRWQDAVNATRGKIMTQGGNPVKAWYASTSGGYTFNSGDIWSRSTSYTKRLKDVSGDVGSFGDLQDRAYSKESPCFYSAQGARSQYNKSAWLKSEEVADIVNVLILAKIDSSVQKHLSQVDKANPDGAETWDMERVKSELRSRNESPYNTISSVSVSADFGVGKVTTVTIYGDTGSKSYSGSEFVEFFNLRAPANIQIVGPLFNIEKK